jgi:hypothetical protein
MMMMMMISMSDLSFLTENMIKKYIGFIIFNNHQFILTYYKHLNILILNIREFNNYAGPDSHKVFLKWNPMRIPIGLSSLISTTISSRYSSQSLSRVNLVPAVSSPLWGFVN